jgi:hypothetical protein
MPPSPLGLAVSRPQAEVTPFVRDVHLVTRVVDRAVICTLGLYVGDGSGCVSFLNAQAGYRAPS